MNHSIENRIDAIILKLELVDKIGEMTQYAIDVLSVGEPYNLDEPHTLDPQKLRKALLDQRAGSILNVGGYAYDRDHWHEIMETIQDLAVNEKPSGIPVLYGIDAIHGASYTLGATLFPQQIGLAATWNRDLAEKMGAISAYETKASGIPWAFSPVLDVGRDPRWPRLWETFGEDTYLCTEMGLASLKGYQGENLDHPEKVVACLKHFVGYSQTLSGRDRSQAWIPERQLREYFILPFAKAIESGARTLMVCSGEINGIPVHSNKKILTDILKEELNFTGFAVSDWEDIGYLYTRHMIAHDYKEAIEIAINAGIDMAMVPMDMNYPVLLRELVEEGKIPLERIDDAVRRILRVKLELGLFEQPVPDKQAYEKFGSQQFIDESYKSAAESLTLLKNDNNVLPLKKGANVLVTGPTANSLNYLNGGWTWTWQGNESKYHTEGKKTILDAIRDVAGSGSVRYVEGTTFEKTTGDIEAIRVAKNSDAVIVCLGEETYTEFMGNTDDMRLPEAQYELVRAVASTGKPIVFVLVEGKPRIIEPVETFANAIVMAYLPGSEGGRAIADVLFGDVNPSGKLPFTYPRFPSGFMTYDHKKFDRIDKESSFMNFNPQFEFGHGLSYTSFEYKDLTLSSNTITDNDNLKVTVEVVNTGDRMGKESVLLFVSDLVASITPSVKRLRGFQKINLESGQSKTVTFEISPKELAFVGKDNRWTTEKGKFTVNINDLTAEFVIE